MKYIWSCVVAWAVVVGSDVRAGEPYLEFISGLRARGYYDTALQYIDSLEQDSKVPQDVKTVLPFERGMTLLDNSRTLRSPDARSKMLDQAQVQLENFVKASPNSPLAAEANSQQANIFLGRARVSVWQAKSPSNSSKKDELRAEARQLIGRARGIFQKAHDQYKQIYEGFPKFVSPDDKEQYEARSKAEVAYLKAQLDLAQCTYEEGQTYDEESPKRAELLTAASTAFEAIHSQYRSMVGGLYARMWQGKCFEEQGDLQKALGIYNELLGHNGTSRTMQKLQDQVLQFRLIVLNDEDKKEYQLIEQEAGQWLQLAKARARTEIGLGIRWELARALEQRGMDRTQTETDRERFLKQGLEQAKFITRYPGQYKDVSTFMIRRLNVALGKDEQDPTDFGTAFEIGRNMVKQIKPIKDKAEGPQAQDQDRTDYSLHLTENARMLKLALDLSDAGTAVTDLNQARYLLSYVRFLQGMNYDSAILSEFVAKHFIKESPQTALDAAHLALAAYVNAYSAVPDGQSNALELAKMESISDLIAKTWPDSDRANDARMTLGRIYGREGRPAEAGDWYAQVPKSAAQYAEAQLAAGQAYWVAYLETSADPEQTKVTPEQLEQWRTASETHFKTGIAAIENVTPAEKPAPESLTAGQVSLAQLYITKQQYDAAIKELLQGKHNVTEAIKVADGVQRPKKGVTSVEFSRLVYQLMLRAYVGMQKIDAALQTMDELESVGSGAGDTTVYVQLGQELEKELKRLKSLGETEQLTQVRESFETFLNELFKRKDGQSYGSLIWIAETYFGLGLGSDDDPAAASGYFAKASEAYDEILREAQAKGEDFAPADRIPGVKLRLVTCKRSSGDFDTAFSLVSSVLEEKPRALDAQIEAAKVLQDWGDKTSQNDRLLEAINGRDPAWGWAPLAIRLQRTIDAGSASSDQKNKYLEARLASAECRRMAGQSDAAKREIEVFAMVSGEGMPDEWWSKFDSLYRLTQEDLGQRPAKALERPKSRPAQEVAVVATPQAGASGDAANVDDSGSSQAKPKKKAEAEDGGSNVVMVIVSVLLALGVAGGTVFAMAKPKKRRPSYTSAPDSLPTAAPVERPKRQRPQGSPRTRPPGTKQQGRKPTGDQPKREGERPKRRRKPEKDE